MENKFLVGSFIIGIIMQVAVVVIPKIANVFKLVPLNIEQWIYTILISLAPIVIMELQKKFNEIKFGKVVYAYTNKKM